MYIGCGRLSIIITEGQMRIFLMTPVGVVVTTRGRERVKPLCLLALLSQVCVSLPLRSQAIVIFSIKMLQRKDR